MSEKHGNRQTDPHAHSYMETEPSTETAKPRQTESENKYRPVHLHEGRGDIKIRRGELR